ncbi:MAG: hypothetical protein IKC32_02305 [Clostridia bacterium]|nr:hypothetical protein [Clostridia bacterium]
MKKRIISMLLVVCTLVLALASCAYSYDNDDMTAYVNFNKQAFLAGLSTLEIEDADFGTDEDVRWQKVADAIITSLAGKADTEVKKNEGKPGTSDTLYYCYYATFDKDGETVTVYASSMKESSAVKLQLGLSSAEGLDKLIAEKVSADDFTMTDFYYNTDTSAVTKAGDTLVVTYTRSYKLPTADGGTEDKKNTYTNLIITLDPELALTGPEADGKKTAASFEEYLLGVTAGAEQASKTFNENINGNDVAVTYSGIKVNWVVESDIEDNFTVKHTPFPDTTKNVNTVEGASVDLKGKELTYHVFPVYYLEAPELNAKIILEELLGTSMKVGGDADEDGEISDSEKGTLAVFTDDGYKNGEDTLNKLLTKLVELLGDLSEAEDAHEDAEEAKDKAQAAVDKADGSPTKDQSDALDKAKEDLTKAETALKDAEKAVDDQTTKILACTKSGDNVKTVENAIVDDYKQYRYDTLEKTYKSAIKKNLAAAIFALAKENLEYKKNADGSFILPEKAVKEAYDLLINNYEYDYYEGTYSSSSSTTKKTNYQEYMNKGGFVAFLKDELAMKSTDSTDAVYAAIREDAEDAVKDTIIIYVLKSACDGDVSVTAEDIDTFKSSINYLLLQYQMGTDGVKESYYMPALQLDNVLNFFLEEKEEDDGDDNKIDYVRLTYTFKPEDADADEDADK